MAMASRWDGVVLGSARMLFEAGTAIGRDDGELLDWFLATRSEAAFAAVVARHGAMVLRVCRGAARDEQDAQDAFQATFLVLARRAGSIRRRESLASWLYGVARKIAVRARADAIRRRWKERQVVSGATAEAPPDPPSADHTALYEEIDRLPGTYREPIILCYLDGMTYEAAARHLDCPLGTLSIRLKRARERLRLSLTRRGVAIPAGLLGVGLAPSLAPAAVPSALATLAVRSALISVGSKAMVVGTVPTPVASMAGRMTMMMRFKTFAVGLLVCGGAVVAATGSLALKPTMAARTPPPEPAPAQEPRSWVRAFPGGTTVELVGISTHPSNAGSWCAPEGAPLLTPPYDRATYRATTTQERQIYEVAFRVLNQPGRDEDLQLQTLPPSSSSSSSAGLDSRGLSIPGILTQNFDFSKDQQSCLIRFGLAAGVWKTEAASGGRDMMGLGKKEGSVIFGTALEVEGKTHITVGMADSADQLRVVAVDLKGTEHGPGPGQSVRVKVEDFSQIEQIYNLPLAEIREFRLQSRPYEWMTFDGVSLKPRGEAGAPAQKKGAD